MKKAYLAAATMALGALLAQPALAKSPQFSGGTVSMKSDSRMSNQTLTVSGPNGFYQSSSESAGSPSISLMKNGQMADGLYNWEMTGFTNERVVTYKNGLNNGRGASDRGFDYKSVTDSGTFRILNGVQVQAMEEPRTMPAVKRPNNSLETRFGNR